MPYGSAKEKPLQGAFRTVIVSSESLVTTVTVYTDILTLDKFQGQVSSQVTVNSTQFSVNKQ